MVARAQPPDERRAADELRRQERSGDDERGGNPRHRRLRRPQPEGGAGLRARRDARRRDTLQDHAKLKLAYDITPTLRASYTLGWWRNDADRDVDSFLRDAVGGDGDERADAGAGQHRRPQLHRPADRLLALDDVDGALHPRPRRQEQHARRVGLRGRRQPVRLRARHRPGAGAERRQCRAPAGSPTSTAPAGTRSPRRGSGGRAAAGGAHVVEFGAQRDAFKLETLVSDTPDWSGGDAGGALLGLRRTHLADQPLGPGRLALRARLARRPRRSRRALAGRGRQPVERDDDAGLRAAQRVVRVAEGGALLAGDAKPGCCEPRSAAPFACRPSASCSRARSRPTRSSTTTRT